jgi:NAD(P)-dependent dehydrogenase (short-subunit alcohol dehydrogenase family)
MSDSTPGRGRLTGRRILIVGAGQNAFGLDDPPIGNGRAMARLFAREGAALALSDIDADSLTRTADEARAEGGRADTIVADAATEDGARAAFEQAAAALGGLDGLVMNVGIGAGLGLRGTSVADWDRTLAVNLRAHFLGCKLALDAMPDGGAVVLIGSIAAREVMPLPAYGASKAALESLARQAAVEGAPAIRVNLLMPGLIDTAIGRFASKLNPRRDEVHIPAGRQGTAWEVASAALFLIGDEASYVTGQSLIVDGGLTVAPRR